MIQLINRSAHDTGLPDKSVHMIATSPPYWGLRAYAGAQKVDWMEVIYAPMPGLPPVTVPAMTCALGQEQSPREFIGHLILVMREAWRVLRDDGVAWVNLGDSYAARMRQAGDKYAGALSKSSRGVITNGTRPLPDGLKEKDLVQIPAMFSLAVQADGWYVRSEIPWIKKNGMPGSQQDRPTTSHEKIFILTKNQRYFWDQSAVLRPLADSSIGRMERKQNTIDMFGVGTLGKQVEEGEVEQANGYAGLALARNGKTGYNLEGRYIRTTDWWFDSLDAQIEHLCNLRDNGGVMLDADGMIVALQINTSGYSGAKGAGDDVGKNGKPYIASLDCPVHGHLARRQRSYMAEYDEQSDQIAICTSGSDDHHDPLLPSVPASKTFHNYLGETSESVHSQTTESNLDYKSGVSLPERISGDENPYHTNRTSIVDELSDHKKDSDQTSCSQTANVHSNQNHKTGHDLVTSQPYTSYVETDSHIDDKSTLPLFSSMPQESMDGNSISAVYDEHGRDLNLTGKVSRNSSKRDRSSDNPPENNYKCTCKIPQVNHFATWPEELVEPMILSSTSARGVCPECGAPWKRVTGRLCDCGTLVPTQAKKCPGCDMVRDWKADGEEHPHFGENDFSTPGRGVPRKDGSNGLSQQQCAGWEPTCAHGDLEPIPATVLDLFSGSGTTGKVALKLNRKYIGIDISSEYQEELAPERLTTQIGFGI